MIQDDPDPEWVYDDGVQRYRARHWCTTGFSPTVQTLKARKHLLCIYSIGDFTKRFVFLVVQCVCVWLVSRTRWDETDGIASPIVHRYILHFFLEDGTVEMRELADIKGGKARQSSVRSGGLHPSIVNFCASRSPSGAGVYTTCVPANIFWCCLTPGCNKITTPSVRVFSEMSRFQSCNKRRTPSSKRIVTKSCCLPRFRHPRLVVIIRVECGEKARAM